MTGRPGSVTGGHRCFLRGLFFCRSNTSREAARMALATGTVGLSLPTLRRRRAAIVGRHVRAGREPTTEHAAHVPASSTLQPRPRLGRAEEGTAPHRAAAGDPDGDAGRQIENDPRMRRHEALRTMASDEVTNVDRSSSTNGKTSFNDALGSSTSARYGRRGARIRSHRLRN